MSSFYFENNYIYVDNDIFDYCSKVKIVQEDIVLGTLDKKIVAFELRNLKSKILKVYALVSDKWYYYETLYYDKKIKYIDTYKIQDLLEKRTKKIKGVLQYGN